MITDKEILERLQKGESIEDIMKEIEVSVNSALSEKQRLDEEKAAEAKRIAEEQARLEAEKAKRADKYNAVCELLLAVGSIGKAWGWQEVVDVAMNCDADEINELVDTIDAYGEMVKMYAQIGGLTFPLGGSSPKVEVKPQPKVEKKPEPTVATKIDTADEIIKKFLMGNKLF